MELVKAVGLNFEYALATHKSLTDIDLQVDSGDFITVAGPSGSGKTTLLRQLKPELWPVGKRTGTLTFEGHPLRDLAADQSAQSIGMVFQSPDNQLVMDNVLQELAFSLENIGLPTDEIQKRIAELVSFLGLQDLLYADVQTLSGGQKQLVNLAAVLILRPRLLLLDEPTAQLDPIATKEFMALLKRVHDELGIAIVMNEHVLDDVLPLSNKLLIVNDGRIAYHGPVGPVLQQLWHDPELRDFVPDVPYLFLQHGIQAGTPAVPLNVVSGRQLLHQHHVQLEATPQPRPVTAQAAPALQVKRGAFEYVKNGAYILDNLTLTVQTGDWLAIIGKNGTGKTTLLKVLMGLLPLRRGTVKLLGRSLKAWGHDAEAFHRTVSYLSQTPSDYFSYDTIWEEYVQRATQLGLADPQQAARDMLATMTISTIAQQNPHDASGGEQQLIALGLLLLSTPRLLLLDEPTKGLDPLRRQKLGRILQRLRRERGLTIVMVSHDMSFSAQFANQCALLFDGQVVSQAEPHRFFAENFFYTTTINRLVRDQLPTVIDRGEVAP